MIIYLPIDPKLNPSTLRIGDFGFGSFNFSVPPNTSHYTTRLDVRDSLGVFVDVTAGIDVTNRRAFWNFQSIDPATGLGITLPADAGFLPVNDSLSHKGEGYVTLTLQPLNTVVTGDTVSAQAAIIFDTEETIKTNIWTNTIDAVAPSSKIGSAQVTNNAILLSWTGTDDTGGTGVKEYALYVSENDGPWSLYQQGLTATELLFIGNYQSRYSFFTVAADHTGNLEKLKTKPDISVNLSAEKLSQQLSFDPLPELTYGDQDLVPGARASSGLPVSYLSSDTTIATIADGNRIRIVSAGTVRITASQEGNGTYKAAESMARQLTVHKKELKVTADNQVKVYGSANPELTVVYTGFVRDEDAASLARQAVAATEATELSPVGAYSITVSGAESPNYSFTYADGMLTVQKAPLTITAENKERFYGAPDPVFTFTYAGFAGTDGPAVLQAGPLAQTAATISSDAGIYTITASGAIALNYDISYISGTLTVLPAPRVLSFEPLVEKAYGDPPFDLNATVNTPEIIQYSSSDPSVAVVENGMVRITGAGTALITASVPDDSNYTGTREISHELKVNKAKQTISFAPIPVLRRRANAHELEVSASSGLPVQLSLSKTEIASLNATLLMPLRVGTAYITATQGGDSNYLPAERVERDFRITDDRDAVVRVNPAVSPDGDGINDFLVIEGIENYQDNHLAVVTRNGLKVFEVDGYDNQQRVFRGRNSKGENLPQGTYFYILEYRAADRRERETGYIVIKY